jgi:ribonucleoside-diphosphate reductase subunit M1
MLPSALLADLASLPPTLSTSLEGLSRWDGMGISLEDLAGELEGLSLLHPDYSKLGGRVMAYHVNSKLPSTFTERMMAIRHLPEDDGTTTRRLSPQFLCFISAFQDAINNAISYERDYTYSYVGWRTAIRVYLASHRGRVLESIQDFHMRVAIQHATGLTGRDSQDRLSWCIQEYHDLSTHRKIYATPICRNSGYREPQLSSCFLVHVPDSIEGIYKALGDCAKMHAMMGGCAINMNDVRSMGSSVRSTGGKSSGLISFARAFDHTSSIIESGGRRSGSNALWLEPHHPDILDVLTSRSLASTKTNEMRTLFQGLFLNDLFMARVESQKKWTLLDPSAYPGLSELWGTAFEGKYLEYESQAMTELEREGRDIQHEASGVLLRAVPGRCASLDAIDLWNVIKDEISDASIPYLVAKDATNRANQHSNMGTVRQSNLCTEILQRSDEAHTAVCTLGNLILPSYVKDGRVDYSELHAVTKRMCIGLNSVLDSQSLPTPESTRSSEKARSIGIGIQGLANVMMKLGLPFDSPTARCINRRVSEVIYHAALEASSELAEDTAPYPYFRHEGGSYLSIPMFHWEIFGDQSGYPYKDEMICDWERLRAHIAAYGVANSLVTAYAPTSTTSLLEGNEESFQPLTSNLVSRTTLSGDYVMVQPLLCQLLEEKGLWNDETISTVIEDGGSVKRLPLDEAEKAIFRTAFEVSSKSVIEMSHDRQYFVDQGQSLNLFVPQDVDFSAFLDTAIFYGWKLGNKNLMYYARQEKRTEALYVNVRTTEKKEEDQPDGPVCRREEGCLFCE